MARKKSIKQVLKNADVTSQASAITMLLDAINEIGYFYEQCQQQFSAFDDVAKAELNLVLTEGITNRVHDTQVNSISDDFNVESLVWEAEEILKELTDLQDELQRIKNVKAYLKLK